MSILLWSRKSQIGYVCLMQMHLKFKWANGQVITQKTVTQLVCFRLAVAHCTLSVGLGVNFFTFTLQAIRHLTDSRRLSRLKGMLPPWKGLVNFTVNLFVVQHNLCCDNCHSHVAYALNLMRYDGSTSWNMFTLCFLMLFHGKYVRYHNSCSAQLVYCFFCCC